MNPFLRPSVAALALTLAAGTALAATGTPAGAVSGPGLGDPGPAVRTAALKLSPRLAEQTGPTAVFVRTTGRGALAVDAAAKGGDLAGRRSAAATARVADIRDDVAEVTAAAQDEDDATEVLYSSAFTVPGVALVADADVLTTLAARDDVVSIAPLVPKSIPDPQATPKTDGGVDGVTPANAGSDVYTRALQAWQATGHTGTGINVAVVDTGLDYTHADFGGPGTRAAYDAALASTAAPDPSLYDAAKYLGGHDFAGSTYNADSSGGSGLYDPLPQPDENPVDGPGGGHGTHVSGTAGGYGVSADGSTFHGDYTTLTPAALTQMKIGPGSAPGVGLYALKVFGDYGGSTDLSGAALDWIGAALTKGAQIDVVNLSLGSEYSAPDDPDNDKVAALVAQGVLPVISAGNSGNVTDIGGSPGNSAAALTVAAAASGYGLFDQVSVTGPAALAGDVLAQYSVNYEDPLDLEADVTPLADAGNLDGCDPLSDADRARVQGKIAWLTWDDDDLECGSAVRFDNVAHAGGIGVVLTSTRNVFDTGIAGDALIPGAQLTADATAALADAAAAGTLRVAFSDELRGTVTSYSAATADHIAPFSSRGIHGSYDDVVKPDIAAPGVGVVSAEAGGGTARTVMSGTSMASPHTAGVAALVRQSHPDWTPTEVKADLMNTAAHDTVTADGTPTSVQQQGTGRVDAAYAVDNQVTVASQENDALVTASFGVVEASAPVRRGRTLVLTNHGATPASYDVTVQDRQALAGVTYDVDRDSVTVPAGGTASVRLRLSIPDPSALRRVIDPTQSRTVDIDGTSYDRDFVPAASATVHFTPTAGTEIPLRLTAFAAPEPVSAMRGSAPVMGAGGTGRLPLTGRPLTQGTGEEAYAGQVAPFVLGAWDAIDDFSGDAAAQTLAGLDLRVVGASSTAPLHQDRSQGLLSFGMVMGAPASVLGGPNYPEVLLDVDRDGSADFSVGLARSSTTDSGFSVTTDLVTGDTIAAVPQEGNVFDTRTHVVSVPLAALGYEPDTDAEATTLRYQVVSESQYSPTAAETGSFAVDSTRWADFDVFRPALTFTQAGGDPLGSALYADDRRGLDVRRTGATRARVLLLHLHNAVAHQWQVVGPRR